MVFCDCRLDGGCRLVVGGGCLDGRCRLIVGGCLDGRCRLIVGGGWGCLDGVRRLVVRDGRLDEGYRLDIDGGRVGGDGESSDIIFRDVLFVIAQFTPD